MKATKKHRKKIPRDIEFTYPNNISNRNKELCERYKDGDMPTQLCFDYQISWTRVYAIINKYKI